MRHSGGLGIRQIGGRPAFEHSGAGCYVTAHGEHLLLTDHSSFPATSFHFPAGGVFLTCSRSEPVLVLMSASAWPFCGVSRGRPVPTSCTRGLAVNVVSS